MGGPEVLCYSAHVVVTFLLLVSCAPEVEDSPAEMDELARLLLRDQGTDAAVQHAEQLGAWIDTIIDDPEEGYALSDLDASWVEGLTYSPSTDFEAMVGAAVVRRTRGSIAQHVAVVPEADQTFADASSYDRWNRTIVEGDAEDYRAGGALLTDDDIVKSELMNVTLPYPMAKRYGWVGLERGEAQVFRGVIYEEGWAEDGNNGVIAGFSVEAWFPDGEDSVIWYEANWSQVVTIVAFDDDFMANQIIDGIYAYMEGTEAHVAPE